MYKRGFFATLTCAERMWSHYRKQSRTFSRWLDKEELRVGQYEASLPASILSLAVAEGVDEILIAKRTLRGLYDIETRADFWQPIMPEYAFQDDLKAAQTTPQSPGELDKRMDHFAKFTGLSRYDRYISVNGVVSLAGGYETDIFDPYPQIFRENLRRPRRFSIINEFPESNLRGVFCTIALLHEACGVTVEEDAVGLKFIYE